MTNVRGDYFSVERKILKMCGVSLTETETVIYKIYSFAVVIFLLYLYCIFAVMEFFQDHDFEEFSVSLVYNSCMALAAAKVTIMLLNRTELGNILDTLQTGIFARNYERGGETEEKLITDCLRFNNIQKSIYLSVDIASLAGSIIGAFIKRLRSSDYRDWELGFSSFTIIDTTKSPNYELVMIYQDIAFVVCGLTFSVTDLTFVGILSHLSTQFRILQNNLKFVARYSKIQMDGSLGLNTKDLKISDSQLRESLKGIVSHHLAIIDLANKVERIYKPLLLIIYLSNMGILCFGLYMVPLMTGNKKFSLGIGEVSVCIQLFVTCYWCDRMTTESLAVGNAAYEAEFVGTQPKFQKDLVFIMRRSIYPTVMTAGGFFNITLPTFLKILQAAYSFIMVIRNKV